MWRRGLPFILAALVVLADQLSKAYVVLEVPIGARVASWAGFLHLTHTQNSGAAFGMLRDRALQVGSWSVDGVALLGLVSLLVAIGLVIWLWRDRQSSLGTRLILGLVLGGALGNGVDRLRLGYVTDFIHVQVGWFDFPVFNVADMAVVVGAALLLIATLLIRPKAEPLASTPPAEPGPDETHAAGEVREGL